MHLGTEKKFETRIFSQRNVLIMASAEWTCTTFFETNIKCPLSLSKWPSFRAHSIFFYFAAFFSVDIFIQTSLVLMRHENCAHWSMNVLLYLDCRNVDVNGSDLYFCTSTNLRHNALKGFSVTKSTMNKKKSDCDILSHFKRLSLR